VKQTDTVGSFNELIYEYEGIPIKDQKLYYFPTRLYLEDEDETFSKYCDGGTQILRLDTKNKHDTSGTETWEYTHWNNKLVTPWESLTLKF